MTSHSLYRQMMIDTTPDENTTRNHVQGRLFYSIVTLKSQVLAEMVML